MNNQWVDTLNGKIAELELVASWASMTNYSRVRDLCREASAELVESLKRHKAQLAAAEQTKD